MLGVGCSMLDVRPGSWEASFRFCARIGTINHPPHPPFGHPLPLRGAGGRGEGGGSWVLEGFRDGGGIQMRPASGASPQTCLIRLTYFCRRLSLCSPPPTSLL